MMPSIEVCIYCSHKIEEKEKSVNLPAGVAHLARKLKKPVFAFVGRATEDRQVREMFDGVYQNARAGMSTEENMKRAAELLRDNARQLGKNLK